LLCAGELLLGHHRLQHLEDIVPERVVVLVQEDNEAGRLRVEAGGHMENGLLSDVGDLLVWDGGLLVELVVGAALLDGVEEGLLRRHVCGCREGWRAGYLRRKGCSCRA
jgi:hypothetical protein